MIISTQSYVYYMFMSSFNDHWNGVSTSKAIICINLEHIFDSMQSRDWLANNRHATGLGCNFRSKFHSICVSQPKTSKQTKRNENYLHKSQIQYHIRSQNNLRMCNRHRLVIIYHMTCIHRHTTAAKRSNRQRRTPVTHISPSNEFECDLYIIIFRVCVTMSFFYSARPNPKNISLSVWFWSTTYYCVISTYINLQNKPRPKCEVKNNKEIKPFICHDRKQWLKNNVYLYVKQMKNRTCSPFAVVEGKNPYRRAYIKCSLKFRM